MRQAINANVFISELRLLENDWPILPDNWNRTNVRAVRCAFFGSAKNLKQFPPFGGLSPRVEMRCHLPDFPVTRVDDQTWRVSTMNTHSLTVTYKVFANDLSGTFSQLDARHAN